MRAISVKASNGMGPKTVPTLRMWTNQALMSGASISPTSVISRSWVKKLLRRGERQDFVEHNNQEASLFLAQNKRGDEYGYILTTTSEPEFKRLTTSLRN